MHGTQGHTGISFTQAFVPSDRGWRDPTLYRLSGTLLTRYRYCTDSTVGMMHFLLWPAVLVMVFSKRSLILNCAYLLLLLIIIIRLTKTGCGITR